MTRELIRVAIGLVIPFAAVLISVPIVGHVDWTVMGLPFVVPCSLALFVLTSGCMGVCWLVFDRDRPGD